jgi:hypothetical protein
MINVVIILVVLAAAAGALTLAFRVKKGVEPGPVRSLATIGFFVVGVLLVGAGLSGVIRAYNWPEPSPTWQWVSRSRRDCGARWRPG